MRDTTMGHQTGALCEEGGGGKEGLEEVSVATMGSVLTRKTKWAVS
jgi:hypothetical protein